MGVQMSHGKSAPAQTYLDEWFYTESSRESCLMQILPRQGGTSDIEV